MAKLTKEEQIQAIYDLKVGYTLCHDDVAMLKAMARQLLSGLEQEPVATFYKSECGNVFNTLDSWLPVEGVNNLYAAPQLPQPAVPDEMTPKQASRSYCGEVRGYRDGWNACRAAMLIQEKMMDNRYEIAEQNGMSREFADWFFDNKKSGCGNAWFMMMAAMWEGWKGRAAMTQVVEPATDNTNQQFESLSRGDK